MTITSPVSLSRRHVLGDLYGKCGPLADEVPVYLSETDAEPTLKGHVDQSLGHFADAFSFHIPDEMCKDLTAGRFTFSFQYEKPVLVADEPQQPFTIVSITLVTRKSYTKPVPRRQAASKSHHSEIDPTPVEG